MKFGGWFRLEDLQLEDQRLDVFEAVAFCMLKASIKQFASTQLWHTGVVPFTVQLRMTQHDTILVCRGTLVRQLLSPSFFFQGVIEPIYISPLVTQIIIRIVPSIFTVTSQSASEIIG